MDTQGGTEDTHTPATSVTEEDSIGDARNDGAMSPVTSSIVQAPSDVSSIDVHMQRPRDAAGMSSGRFGWRGAGSASRFVPEPASPASSIASRGVASNATNSGGNRSSLSTPLRPTYRRDAFSVSSKGSGGGRGESSFRGSPGDPGLLSARRLFRAGSLAGSDRSLVSSSGSRVLDASAHIALTAAGEGDLNVVTAFLDSGGDVNAKSKTGQSTPLSRASSKGHLAIVGLLLERGAAVNIPGRGGMTPLHEAAGCEQLEACRLLLGAGAAVAARDHARRTPLHYAGCSAEVTQLLLDFGADPEAKDKNGQKPDDMAVNNEARALLRDARCLVRESGAGDNASRLIASLRRELDGREHETLAAKAKADEEAQRVKEQQAQIDDLREKVLTLTKDLVALRKAAEEREADPEGPAAVQAELRQAKAALRVARAAAAAERSRREALESQLEASVAEAVAKALAANNEKGAAADRNSDDNITKLVSPEGMVGGGEDGASATTTITREIPTSSVTQKLDQQHTASPVSISPVCSPRILTNRRRDLYAQAARRGYVEQRIREPEELQAAAMAAAGAHTLPSIFPLPPPLSLRIPSRWQSGGILSRALGSPGWWGAQSRTRWQPFERSSSAASGGAFFGGGRRRCREGEVDGNGEEAVALGISPSDGAFFSAEEDEWEEEGGRAGGGGRGRDENRQRRRANSPSPEHAGQVNTARTLFIDRALPSASGDMPTERHNTGATRGDEQRQPGRGQYRPSPASGESIPPSCSPNNKNVTLNSGGGSGGGGDDDDDEAEDQPLLTRSESVSALDNTDTTGGRFVGDKAEGEEGEDGAGKSDTEKTAVTDLRRGDGGSGGVDTEEGLFGGDERCDVDVSAATAHTDSTRLEELTSEMGGLVAAGEGRGEGQKGRGMGGGGGNPAIAGAVGGFPPAEDAEDASEATTASVPVIASSSSGSIDEFGACAGAEWEEGGERQPPGRDDTIVTTEGARDAQPNEFTDAVGAAATIVAPAPASVSATTFAASAVAPGSALSSGVSKRERSDVPERKFGEQGARAGNVEGMSLRPLWVETGLVGRIVRAASRDTVGDDQKKQAWDDYLDEEALDDGDDDERDDDDDGDDDDDDDDDDSDADIEGEASDFSTSEYVPGVESERGLTVASLVSMLMDERMQAGLEAVRSERAQQLQSVDLGNGSRGGDDGGVRDEVGPENVNNGAGTADGNGNAIDPLVLQSEGGISIRSASRVPLVGEADGGSTTVGRDHEGQAEAGGDVVRERNCDGGDGGAGRGGEARVAAAEVTAAAMDQLEEMKARLAEMTAENTQLRKSLEAAVSINNSISSNVRRSSSCRKRRATAPSVSEGVPARRMNARVISSHVGDGQEAQGRLRSGNLQPPDQQLQVQQQPRQGKEKENKGKSRRWVGRRVPFLYWDM